MSQSVRDLQPHSLWNHFADLNAVPRASKKEEKVIQFMVDFGKSLNLDTLIDEVGNVIIKKPATPGMESRQTVVLQSHLDMVHQKNADTPFDFESEGIKMLVEEDWVRADGTTLGADNGIGVATIMAVLASNDWAHPAIEALFTIDEETGMTGALGLKGGLLSGSILLNLDTEDDDELTIGCAGGIDVTATGQYQEVASQKDSAFTIKMTGLTGGHSGMDIHKGRGNANKLMNRLLYSLSHDVSFELAKIDGGGLRNAIPRESFATVVLSNEEVKSFKEAINDLSEVIKTEYATTDPALNIAIEKASKPEMVMPFELQNKLIKAIYVCPSGIYRMSPDVDDLVQTSNNLARVEIDKGQYSVLCLTRSSLDSEKFDMVNVISSAFGLVDATVTTSGSYPGWTPNPSAPIIKMMSDLYEEMFSEQPNVYACHAGLECGILGTNYPGMDMISFGPNIRGAHSPDEKVQISSVQKYWKFFKETLQRIPEKK